MAQTRPRLHKRLHNILREAWRIAGPYWFSEEKWRGLGLLSVVVLLNLAQVALNIRFNYWHNAFYNTLQNLDEAGFYHQILIFAVLAIVWVAVGTSLELFGRWFRITWRRWLTERYLRRWLSHRAYYRLQLLGDTDNPDQRIAEDAGFFVDRTYGLTIDLVSKVVSLVSFLYILWSLAGPLTIDLGSIGAFTIPAYMVWLVLVYAVIGTVVAVKLGRPLIGLNFNQQRYEADFRYSLVRLREHTESVAFYGGEPIEFGTFRERFASVFQNFIAIMWRTLKFGSFQFGFGQASVIFPYLIQAPRFFARQIQLGDLTQTAGAFNNVLDSLSFIINSYESIASWQAIIQRLATFENRVEEIEEGADNTGDVVLSHDSPALAVDDLTIDLPNGKRLLTGVHFEADAQHPLLITGRNGIGKSTVLRALSGLWPFGRGKVRLPEGRVFFVPQKPYLPLGTLRMALAYPEDGAHIPDPKLQAALRQVGLGALEGELETVDLWAQRLSVGEQQRLAFARVLLAEPMVIFLDEATSALDEATEAQFYRMLREAPWHPTVISVGHRGTLRALHERVLDLSPFSDERTAALPAAN